MRRLDRSLRSLRPGAPALLAAAVLSFAAPAGAGTLFASGDATPAYYADTDNQQFFGNILQGGVSVVTHDLINGGFSLYLNGYYNGLGGVTSTDIGNAAVTAAVLGGADLFISQLASDALSGAEIAALSTFLANDGTVMLMGDYLVDLATRLDTALAALGSGMSVVDIGNPIDLGAYYATGAQIASDPFTSGVTSLHYGATHEIGGGTVLFYSSDGHPFMAYESTAAGGVPEPGVLGLLGLGLAGIGFARRRARPTGG